MTFPEAKRLLAERTGSAAEPASWPRRRAVPGQSAKTRTRCSQAMAWAVEQFHHFLLHSPTGRSRPRTYLQNDRSTGPASTAFGSVFLRSTGIGCCNKRRARRFPAKCWRRLGWRRPASGPAASTTSSAGVCCSRSAIRNAGRLPWEAADSTSYSSEPEKTAKYINSRETRLFSKSEQLYGLHLAKDAIQRQDGMP